MLTENEPELRCWMGSGVLPDGKFYVLLSGFFVPFLERGTQYGIRHKGL